MFWVKETARFHFNDSYYKTMKLASYFDVDFDMKYLPCAERNAPHSFCRQNAVFYGGKNGRVD